MVGMRILRSSVAPHRIGDGIVLELNLDPNMIVHHSIRILKHCGQDPSQVLLRLS